MKSKSTKKTAVKKTTTKKVTAKTATANNKSVKVSPKKIHIKNVETPKKNHAVTSSKVLHTTNVKHDDVKKESQHLEDKMFGLFRTCELSELFVTIVKIIVFGAIISMAFSYGGDNIGIVSIGAIVTILALWQHKEHSKQGSCGSCAKTLIIGGVIGGLSTWIFMVLGSLVAGTSGYVIGIIIGITVALKIAPQVCHKK